jgi:hypothetical protein
MSIIWSLLSSLLIVIRIRSSVLVVILGISVLDEFIMSSLIEGRELAAFPLFKLLLRMLITFIHIFMLCTLLLIPLLLSLSLPLIQIVKIFL